MDLHHADNADSQTHTVPAQGRDKTVRRIAVNLARERGPAPALRRKPIGLPGGAAEQGELLVAAMSCGKIVPLKVEYALSAEGRILLPVNAVMHKWGVNHLLRRSILRKMGITPKPGS